MTSWKRRAAVVGAALTLGLLAGVVADRHAAGITLLLLEPVLWAAAAGAALYLALRRRVPDAVAAIVAGVLFGVGARLFAPFAVTPPPPNPALAELGRCARDGGGGRGGVDAPWRAASWNVQVHRDREATIRAALAFDADVLVLQEVKDLSLVDEIARRSNGDAVHAPAMLGWGTAVIVADGRIVPCGGRRIRVVELAAENGRRAVSVATVVESEAVGRIPVVTIHTDRPASLAEVYRWPRALETSARRVGAAVRAIDHPAVLVAGDTNTHATFHRFHSILAAAGVELAPSPATWPARLGGVPVPPLYVVDRIGTGPAWRVARLRAARPAAPSDHLAIIAEIEP